MSMKSIAFLAIVVLVGICALPCLAAPASKAKTQLELEKEVIALRAKSKRQEHMVRSAIIGVAENAVRAPFGRFLLIKNGSQCLALRMTEHVDFRIIENTRRYTAKYEWFLQTDGSADFSRDNVQKGTGEVSEVKNGSYAAAYIQAGAFPLLEWSSGDWIYFTIGATPLGGHQPGSAQALREKNIRMASTEWIRIEDVDPQSRTLLWLSKAQAKGIIQ